MHIAVAGNIGSGKTTLTKMLASHYGWTPRFESVDYNPYLADFYEEHFQFGDPTSPGDKDSNNKEAHVYWRANYYINGLSKTVLDNNSWLGQTKGWTDQNGAAGTIFWQDDEVLNVD